MRLLCLQALRYRTSPRLPPRQGVRLPGRALRRVHWGMRSRRGQLLLRLPGALQRNVYQCDVRLFGSCFTVLVKLVCPSVLTFKPRCVLPMPPALILQLVAHT